MALKRSRYIAAVLVLAAASAFVLLSTSRASAAGCSTASWPAVARSGSAPHSAAAISEHAGRWHVTLRPGGSGTLTGVVRADARLSSVRHTTGLGRYLHRTRRTLSFSLPASAGVQRFSFVARCARHIGFKLSTTHAAIGGTPAPSTSFGLDRPAATGVAGQLLVGPTCPVDGPRGCPPSQPAQGTVQISTAPASRSAPQTAPVATVASDANGNYSASLAPGTYQLTATASNTGPYAGHTSRTAIVEVTSGVITDANLIFDTGIR